MIFTALVDAAIATAGIPTGEVQFQVDGSNFGQPVPLSDGSAALTTSALPVGMHTITALYRGAQLFVESSGSAVQNVQYTFSGFLPPLSQNLAFTRSAGPSRSSSSLLTSTVVRPASYSRRDVSPSCSSECRWNDRGVGP